LIFGRITTSYQKKKEECLEKGLILRTTSKQWFDLLKNRGGETPSRLYIEVQCAYKEEHVNSVQIGHVMNCVDCRNEAYLNRPLTLTDILGLASERNIIAISFKDDSQQLTESEFNELVEAYEVQHQDSRDYKSKSTVYINLRWMCLDCNRIFERAYYLVKMAKVDRYCPSCVSSIDAQITLEKTGAAFQGYISQSFRSNEQLYKFLPERILLMDKYQVISHPNCHVDVYGVIFVAGKEFKIAIEHQGPQHYSLTAYINMARAQDIKRGIYKTNQQYEEDFNAQVERDKTKVELFEDLNKDGYYLIVVPYWVSPSERKDFILQEFITQTGVNPGQPSILDYL
jgi:hypothetical protein